MSFLYQEGRRGGDEEVSEALSVVFLSSLICPYICLHELIDSRQDVLVTRDVLEGIWTVLLNPKNVSGHVKPVLGVVLTMADCLLLLLGDWLHSSCPWNWCCRS